MDFALSEEQEMLRDTARQYLDHKSGSDWVRTLMETDAGFDVDQWKTITQMGWPSMHIPEEFGGAGFTVAEVNVLLEEMGRRLLPSPFFATVVLGVNALLESGDRAKCERILPAVASGELRLALAHAEQSSEWRPAAIQLTASRQEGHFVLSGEKHYVIDGHTADQLIVSAVTDAGVTLFLVDRSAPGVSAESVVTMDMTRKLAAIAFSDVELPLDAVIGEEGKGAEILARTLDLAVVSLAAEQVGGAAFCLEQSVEYAKVRRQFGRAIGSFQAIKHKCADMLIAVESARSASRYATYVAASGDRDELQIAAPVAKAFCSDIYFNAASDMIQIHGGIGFTWEHDAHLYFKRAESSKLLFGDPGLHRERLAEHLAL